jgi:hypothetical protein
VTTSNTSDAVTIDRDLLPKELVKKLGLFKINLLPKTHPERGILNKLPLLTTRPPVPRIETGCMGGKIRRLDNAFFILIMAISKTDKRHGG